ncbi:MAG: ABC transporter permease [Gemmatimonadota bacterium]
MSAVRALILRRELAPAVAFGLLLTAVAVVAPAFFTATNLRDLALNNASVLLVSVGMTLVILLGEIDISVGAQFAVCSVVTGTLAASGVPALMLLPCAMLTGCVLGALNGVLIGVLGLPSIVVTLAMLVAWRDLLRWTTQGAWITGLPADFQWFGFSAAGALWMIVGIAVAVLLAAAWALRTLRVGRAIYAVGSDRDAAHLAGIPTSRVVTVVFTLTGALVGLAAALNAVRFDAVPSNAGVGLEMKAIAAVVVGGVAITGGRGTLLGTLIGVCLLGTIGTALSFVGINPYWEKAIQGAIILAALVSGTVLGRLSIRAGGSGHACVAAK